MPHILLVDDEAVLTTSLSFTLQQQGYRVSTATDGISALRLVKEHDPDLVVLDLMLPGLDGLKVCRQIRGFSQLPVIMLTARGQEDDKVTGLRSGADDYVTKPFSSRELVARIEAVLRRHNIAVSPDLSLPPGSASDARDPELLAEGALRLDLPARQAWFGEVPLNLSPKEFQLLWVLMLHRGRALSREELIAAVWGDSFMGDQKTLDVHIRWLRAKIEPLMDNQRHIQTVRCFGFRFG